MGFGWEYTVQSREPGKRRKREREGLPVAEGMVEESGNLGLDKLAAFQSFNTCEVATMLGGGGLITGVGLEPPGAGSAES